MIAYLTERARSKWVHYYNPCTAFLPLGAPQCAKSVVLPADFMSSGGAAPLGAATPEPSKLSWVPLAVGAALVGGVLWFVAKGVSPVLANPSSSWETWAEKMVTMAELGEPTRTGKHVTRETIETIKNETSDPRTRMRAAVLLQGTRWSTRANPGLPDGVAKREGFTAKDADPKELARGTKHEMEHTRSKRIARQIALDHLAETPDYYRRLEAMERGVAK